MLHLTNMISIIASGNLLFLRAFAYKVALHLGNINNVSCNKIQVSFPSPVDAIGGCEAVATLTTRALKVRFWRAHGWCIPENIFLGFSTNQRKCCFGVRWSQSRLIHPFLEDCGFSHVYYRSYSTGNKHQQLINN